jgi:hypothetical protein
MNIKSTIELLALIDTTTHQTGTVAYGLPNPKDNDRFCTQSAFNAIVSAATAQGIETGIAEGYNDSRSVTLALAGQSFNLFVVPDEDIDVMLAVTDMVTAAAQRLPEAMSRKTFRVMLFRVLRDTLTMMRKESIFVIISKPEPAQS